MWDKKKDQNMLASHTSQYLHVIKAINSAIQKQMQRIEKKKTNSNIQTNKQKQAIKTVRIIYSAYQDVLIH